MSTVLVVDDSAVVQRIISMTLENNGFSVITANDGQEALSILSEMQIDLVLADILMPRMNGLEMVKHFRERFPDKETPILMLTALDEKSERQEAMTNGATGFLTKPTNSHDLIDAVKQALDS